MKANRRYLAFLKYQFKIIWGVNFYLAPLVALLIPVSVNYPFYADPDVRIFWAVKMNEMFFPIIGIIIFSNLLSTEWENKTVSLWLSKPLPRSLMLVSRIIIGAGYLLVVLTIPILFQHARYAVFNIPGMLLTVYPSALFLGILGLSIGTLTQNSPVSFLIPIAYWIMEIATKSRYTGPLGLFSRATHPACLTNACMQYIRGTDWILPKIAILFGSLGLIFLTALLLKWKGRKFIHFQRTRSFG